MDIWYTMAKYDTERNVSYYIYSEEFELKMSTIKKLVDIFGLVLDEMYKVEITKSFISIDNISCESNVAYIKQLIESVLLLEREIS